MLGHFPSLKLQACFINGINNTDLRPDVTLEICTEARLFNKTILFAVLDMEKLVNFEVSFYV